MSVALRRAAADDAAFLHELIHEEDTAPYLGRTPDSHDALAAEIERGAWYVIEADGKRAGCVAYDVVNERNGIVQAERFAIAPAFRGRGIGIEAARAFQRILLLELGFHRIELQIYGFNDRAIAHAQRSGYVREGVKRRAYLKHGEWQDAVLFALLREDLD